MAAIARPGVRKNRNRPSWKFRFRPRLRVCYVRCEGQRPWPTSHRSNGHDELAPFQLIEWHSVPASLTTTA
jgi:hypothetical protein